MTFTAHRGTNISHWLSQSDRRGPERAAWFTRDDVQRIAGFGFDHIRLPIDEEQMWAEDGTREPDAFQLLQHALDWTAEAGLKVIVDLHILRSHHFLMKDEPALYTDPAAMQHFADLWRDLSAFLHEQPVDRVAYELLNEAVAHNPTNWNRVAHTAFDAIRELEAQRTILLGSNQFCQVQTFPDLDVPDDDHLILTFHYYNPMFLTHYRAPWTETGAYHGPIQYPGLTVPEAHTAELDAALPQTGRKENQYFDRNVIENHIRIAYDVAQQHQRPLYCGEFGVYKDAPQADKLRWYQDMIAVFDKLGIGWANWDYKGSFGIITPDGAETGILPALLGQ